MDESENERIGMYEQLNSMDEERQDTGTVSRYEMIDRLLDDGPSRVLEIGCGFGLGGETLKRIKPAATLEGLDCKLVVTKSRQTLYQSLSHGSITSLPYPDDHFDSVVAAEVIEHLYPTDVDRSICEIIRVLKSEAEQC